MTNHATTLDRIIREEVFTLANEFVQELSKKLPSLAETHSECLAKDDYRGAVEDEIRNGLPDVLRDVCEQFGYEPHTDAEAVLADIEADGNWEEVADHLGLDPHTVEALQFWLVSDWLADQLEDAGALVARDVMGFNVWGRTECGQALVMDADLRAVAAHFGTAE